MPPHDHPIGGGPIERLADQVASGQISPEQGEAIARGPDLRKLLSPDYLRALGRYALHLAIRRQPRPALRLQRLTWAAAEAFENNVQWELTSIYCQVVSGFLMEIPDGRLFRRTVALAERAVAEAEAAGAADVAGDLLHFLGVLHLDPYTAPRISTNYEQQIFMWRSRLMDELGDEYYRAPQEELQMPEPAEALATAENYFRRAQGLRSGHLEGLTFKALAQTLEWRRLLGAEIANEEIIRIAREAVEKIDQRRDPEVHAGALGIFERNQPRSLRLDAALFAMPLDALIEAYGLELALGMVSGLAQAQAEEQPLRSLELLHASVRRAWEEGLEEIMAQHLQLELGLLPRALGRAEELWEWKPPVKRIVQEVRERARRERWNTRTLAATLFGVAARSINLDEEEKGLELLSEIADSDEGFAVEYAPELVFLRGHLHVGLASTLVGAGRLEDAVQYYGAAQIDFLTLKLDSLALNLLLRIENLAVNGPSSVAETAIAVLSSTALPLEDRLGSGATLLLQRLYKKCLVAMSNEGKVKTDLLWLLWHTTKGLRLAAALRERPRLYSWKADERGVALLTDLADVERGLISATRDKEQEESVLDEEMLLGAYARPSERRSGDTLEEQQSNLQHAYEQHLSTALLREMPSPEFWHLDLDATRKRLDERTVLLNYYLGASPEGTIAIYFGVVTNEGLVHLSSGRSSFFPDPVLMTLQDGDLELVVHPFSLTIKAHRTLIQDVPGPGRAVLPEGEDALATDFDNYLGPELQSLLVKLHADGKDHLCILPHGPLHFYPFHLLGRQGHVLADDWIVTYLPNLQLLIEVVGERAPETWDSSKVRLVGLSFEDRDPHGLGALPQARAEVEELAKLLAVEPLVDDDATKRAFLAALSDAHCVHLATHGRYRAVAPAFQALYLAPDGDSDGRLAAYEVLELDLQRVRLLTLGACETALGRFDHGDNLRGLPASFFLAGVKTIVGSLWPVSDSASRAFFVTLYKALSSGRSKLDAFAAAQRQTRVEFPEYRDWGAFYLMGAWN